MHLLDFLQGCDIDSVRIVDPSGRIRAGDDLRAKLLSLLDRVDRDVPCTGNCDGLSLDVSSVLLQHRLQEVDQTIACRLCSCKRATVGKSLSGQNALIAAGQSLVLSVQISDLTSADTDVPCRDVCVRADMAVQLIHEALAECHDFPVRLSLRIKVGTALAAPDRKPCQRILEGLLKAEELQRSKRDRRVKTKSSLVRPDGAVELDAVPVVDLNLPLVIYPRNTEHDDTLRRRQSLQKRFSSVFLLLLLDRRAKGTQNLLHSLMELRLRRILCYDTVIDFVYI